MNFVGIDTSSTNTAFVVVDEHGDLKEHFIISPKHEDIKVRCSWVVRDIMKAVTKYGVNTTIVCIESPAFMANGKVIDLSMLVGGVFYCLLNRGYNVSLVTPSANKKYFTGNGKASKEEMIEALPAPIKEAFKEYKKKDDLADAYALAKHAIKLTSS